MRHFLVFVMPREAFGHEAVEPYSYIAGDNQVWEDMGALECFSNVSKNLKMCQIDREKERSGGAFSVQLLCSLPNKS